MFAFLRLMAPRRAAATETEEPGQLACLRADLRRLYADFAAQPDGMPRHPLVAAALNPGFQVVAMYRLARGLHLHGHDTVARVVMMVCCWLSGADFLPAASIGPGFVLTHPAGSGSWATVGRNLRMNGMCQLATTPEGAPTVGDDVYLGVASVVLGPVHIGDGAIIGAKALVTCDVPAGHRAVGVPARILPPKDVA